MVQFDNDVSTENIVGIVRTPSGQVNAGAIGVVFEQYAAGTAIASTTTETSLLTTGLTSQAQGITGSPYVTTTSLPVIPANFLVPGVLYTGRVVGSIANTGTPTLRTRVVLRNSAGTITYTLADTTAVAMTTTTAVDFEVSFDFMTAAIGTSGSLVGRISHRYASTLVPVAAAAVTVDTTQLYTIDVLQTWGASSSSNTLTVRWAEIEVK